MTENLTVIERLKKAKIVQVLVVYLGASWVVLQLADVLQDAVGLPEWVSGFAVLLLVIGLVIILATAWVQSLSSTTAKEEAGEIPTDWQIAPAEALESLKSGKLPHLTWGRAIMGGVMALSLLFGGGGVYVLLTGGRGMLGPQEAGADVAAAGIAVMPFDVVGEGMEVWREGMVDVLATNLDGMGGYRAIDSRTVLARWRERVEGDASPDLRTALEVAGTTGARFGLVGSLVGTPAGVRLNADIYDLSNGEEVAQAFLEGPADSVLTMVGQLSVELTRGLLAETGRDLIAAPRTASITTTSLTALRAHLEGEAAIRRSDFAAAVAAYERAVAADSLFAMAWYRLGDSYGWLDDAGNPQAHAANSRAYELVDRLPVRDQILVRSADGMRRNDFSLASELKDAARNYPDDPEIWYALGENLIHGGRARGYGTWADIKGAFDRAVRLDPSFSPYQVHWVESAVFGADSALAAEALASIRANSVDSARIHYLQVTFDLFLSDESRRDSVLASMDTLSAETLQFIAQWGKDTHPDPAWVERVGRRAYAVSSHPWWYTTVAAAILARGHFRDLEAWTDDPTADLGARVAFDVLAHHLGEPLPTRITEWFEAPEPLSCDPHPDLGCSDLAGWVMARDGYRGLDDLLARNRTAADSLAGVEGQADHARGHADVVARLEAYRALHQRGDTASAVRGLRDQRHRAVGGMGVILRMTLTDLLAQSQPLEALGILSLMDGPERAYARVRAGEIHEGLGNRTAARDAFQSAWTLLQGADEGNGWARRAREGLERTGD